MGAVVDFTLLCVYARGTDNTDESSADGAGDRRPADDGLVPALRRLLLQNTS